MRVFFILTGVYREHGPGPLLIASTPVVVTGVDISCLFRSLLGRVVVLSCASVVVVFGSVCDSVLLIADSHGRTMGGASFEIVSVKPLNSLVALFCEKKVNQDIHF